ncbi:unnamed protein product [Owenia fusiformis]|uniref:Uncharacterized protein n=1 Tax=Owenia fusiformis TaxID=6347 RepID=A0A8J1UVW5_OWEFU|nr:unnamed protein product [Owenia fusiformis]
MGNIISFPVVNPPITFEMDTDFAPTGERIVEKKRRTNRFERITEDFFQYLLEERAEIIKAKQKFLEVDMEAILARYPRWTADDIQDYKTQFQTFDPNLDGLIDFNELCSVLDELGDKTTTATRRKYFDQVDVDRSNGIDFEEFLELIWVVSKPKDPELDSDEEAENEEAGNQLGELCLKGGETAQRVRRLSVVQQMQQGLF